MAFVYILHSKVLDKFYTGSCLNLEDRLKQHKEKAFENSFTSKATDWQVYYIIEDLEYKEARDIEIHIKK